MAGRSAHLKGSERIQLQRLNKQATENLEKTLRQYYSDHRKAMIQQKEERMETRRELRIFKMLRVRSVEKPAVLLRSQTSLQKPRPATQPFPDTKLTEPFVRRETPYQNLKMSLSPTVVSTTPKYPFRRGKTAENFKKPFTFKTVSTKPSEPAFLREKSEQNFNATLKAVPIRLTEPREFKLLTSERAEKRSKLPTMLGFSRVQTRRRDQQTSTNPSTHLAVTGNQTKPAVVLSCRSYYSWPVHLAQAISNARNEASSSPGAKLASWSGVCLSDNKAEDWW